MISFIAPRTAARADALPSAGYPQLERLGLAALVLAALVGFAVYPTHTGYDSLYALLWGRELAGLEGLSFDAYRAPTEHPLAIALGAALAPFPAEAADRITVLATLLSYVALLAGVYRLARGAFSPLVGLAALVVMATRFDFPFLAVRAYIDIPYLALLVWAATLERERPRRGVVPLALLAAAGLLRPEAWVFGGAYALWVGWGARLEGWLRRAAGRGGAPPPRRPGRARRLGYLGLAAAAPCVWVLLDLTVTGDPLHSFHSTSALAGELDRSAPAGEVLGSLGPFLAELVKAPVVAAGLAGLAVGLWLVPWRAAMPALLLLAGVGTFLAIGLAGLSVINRYLLVAAVALSIFAGLAVGGFEMLARGSRGRRVWAVGSALAVAFAAAFTATHTVSLRDFNRELVFRTQAHSSLREVLGAAPVRAALADGCGPISTPTHKLIPEVRWALDLPAESVVARSDPESALRAERGIAIYVRGRKALDLVGFADATDAITQVPPPDFTPIARSRYHLAYANCPPE